MGGRQSFAASGSHHAHRNAARLRGRPRCATITDTPGLGRAPLPRRIDNYQRGQAWRLIVISRI